MNGLDKIIEKITADARTEAEKIRLSAEREIADINHESDEVISRIRQIIDAQTEREYNSIISCAKSSAEMNYRAALLEAKSTVIDNAYDSALHSLLSLESSNYRVLLTNLLIAACKERISSARKMLEEYGETDETGSIFTVSMNEKDLSRYGDAVIKAALNELKGENITLKLSDVPVNIDGGVILTCGEGMETVSVNCSLEMIINSLRDELDGEVYRILFAQ